MDVEALLIFGAFCVVAYYAYAHGMLCRQQTPEHSGPVVEVIAALAKALSKGLAAVTPSSKSPAAVAPAGTVTAAPAVGAAVTVPAGTASRFADRSGPFEKGYGDSQDATAHHSGFNLFGVAPLASKYLTGKSA